MTPNLSAAGLSAAVYTIDATAPTLAALNPFSPADSQGSTNTYAGPSDNLVFRLSESVVKGTGNIRIVNDTDTTTTTIAIGSDEISLDGNVVTINPSSDLVLGKAYHVEVDATALLDLAGNAYTGISGSTNWNFQVPDPAISLNAIGTDSRINASENTGTITVSGTVSANTAGIVSGVVMANISITLTPQEGGTTVTLIANAYDTNSGDWTASIGANTLVNGKTYTVLASLAATISSMAYTATSSSVLEVDTTAPTLVISTPISGGYLNDAEDELPLTISGTSSGADARDVTVLVGSTSKTATIAAGGSWSISLSSAELKALSVGSISITANVSDAAGNAATQATASFVYDRTTPTHTLSDVQISADTSITTDFITNTAAQTITGTLSAVLDTGDTSRFGAGLSSLSNVEAARTQHAAALTEIEAQSRTVSEQILADYAIAVSIVSRLASIQASLKAAADVTTSYDRQFLAGRKSWLDVMNAARELAQTETQLADLQATQLVVTWRLDAYTRGIDTVSEKKK